MKYAIQAAAAVLSAGAYGLVKAQEARKQEEQKQQKLHLRSTSHSHPRHHPHHPLVRTQESQKN